MTAKQHIKFNEKTTLLDFACGYGRHARFYMKDIYPGNLYGSDVMSDFIEICRSTFSLNNVCDVQFDLNNPFPPLKHNSEKFDIIIAYSLFSHLSEDAHFAWLKEYYRVLKPAGLVFLTIRQQAFLNSLSNSLAYCEDLNKGYMRKLQETLGSATVQKRFDNGEYIFTPTGGGRDLTNDFYGDTVIPTEYIHNKWSELFDIVEHRKETPDFPQALICLRKKQE